MTKCVVCKVIIPIINGKPATKYWNVERQEVYCSAECSLKRHTEVMKERE